MPLITFDKFLFIFTLYNLKEYVDPDPRNNICRSDSVRLVFSGTTVRSSTRLPTSTSTWRILTRSVIILCPKCFDTIYLVTYYTKWAETSRTDSIDTYLS